MDKKKAKEGETVSVIAKRSVAFWDPRDPQNIKAIFTVRPFSDAMRRLPFGVQSIPGWVAETKEFETYIKDGSLVLIGDN